MRSICTILFPHLLGIRRLVVIYSRKVYAFFLFFFWFDFPQKPEGNQFKSDHMPSIYLHVPTQNHRWIVWCNDDDKFPKKEKKKLIIKSKQEKCRSNSGTFDVVDAKEQQYRYTNILNTYSRHLLRELYNDFTQMTMLSHVIWMWMRMLIAQQRIQVWIDQKILPVVINGCSHISLAFCKTAAHVRFLKLPEVYFGSSQVKRKQYGPLSFPFSSNGSSSASASCINAHKVTAKPAFMHDVGRMECSVGVMLSHWQCGTLEEVHNAKNKRNTQI